MQKIIDKIIIAAKTIQNLTENKARIKTLFNYKIPSDNHSTFIEIGGCSVHCKYYFTSKDEANLVEDVLNKIFEARIAEAEEYLKPIIKENDKLI